MASSKWPSVPLSNVLTQVWNSAVMRDDQQYKQVTARLHNKGLVLRQEVSGLEIKTKQQYHVRTGQFVYSRIDARNGAMGIVPPELNGAIVSNDFPVFDIRTDRLLPVFLSCYVSTTPFLEQCLAASAGTTNRRRLKEANFLSIAIPLPPLDEQQRIVVRIEALAGRISEAQGLQRSATNEAVALVSAYARKALSELDAEITELREWLSPDREGIQTGPFGAQLGVDDFRDEGVPILTIGNVQYGGLEVKNLRHVSEEKAKRLARFIVQKGDILFARMGTVGRCCVIPPEAAGWLFNYHLIRVALDQNRVEPQFIHWTLRSSPDVEKYLGDTIRGATRQGVNSAIVGSLPCRVPSLPKQKRLVAYLDELHARSEGLTRLQESTQAELAALLPAVLDKAFRGEL